MRKGTKSLLIVLGIILVIILALASRLVGGYNKMVGLDESVKTAWAQVDVQLQRRYDLIPNLVETVKGYAAHEKEVFIRVTEARSKVAGAQTVGDKISANNQLTSALGRLLVVVERYPDLKANTNFIRLQDELAGTENRIAVARRRYNESVKAYNQTIRRFPTNIIAGLFNFIRAPLYQIPEAAKELPKIKF